MLGKRDQKCRDEKESLQFKIKPSLQVLLEKCYLSKDQKDM